MLGAYGNSYGVRTIELSLNERLNFVFYLDENGIPIDTVFYCFGRERLEIKSKSTVVIAAVHDDDGKK